MFFIVGPYILIYDYYSYKMLIMFDIFSSLSQTNSKKGFFKLVFPNTITRKIIVVSSKILGLAKQVL